MVESFYRSSRPIATFAAMALLALAGCGRSPGFDVIPPAAPPPPPPPVVLAPVATVEQISPPPQTATVEPEMGVRAGMAAPSAAPMPSSAPMQRAQTRRPASLAESLDPAEGPPEPAAVSEGAADPQRIFCDRLNDYASPAECAYYNTIWNKLATGSAGVRFPSDLTRGETGVVSLAIALGGGPAGPSAEDLLGRRPDEEFKLKVARRMAAQLQGVGFEIEPGGLQHKDFHMGQGVRWDWKVTALKARRHALTLSTYVVVKGPDGTQSETLLKSVEKDIPVRVTLTQRFSDLVDWVVGISTLTKTLFGALGVILVALIAFRQRLGELKTAFVGK